MGEQSGARIEGDRYQHLYSWLLILDLLDEDQKIDHIRLEHPHAGAADDVTVHLASDEECRPRFYQIKWHRRPGEGYSIQKLIKHRNSSCLLHKFWTSWQEIGLDAEIVLVSNSPIASDDPLARLVNGRDQRFVRAFFEDSERTIIGNARRELFDHLCTHTTISEDNFLTFCRQLRFKLGSISITDLEKWIDDRMSKYGLRTGKSAQADALDIVKRLIEEGHDAKCIKRDDLLRLIDKWDLHVPEVDQPALVLHVHTIEKQEYDLPADIELDWRDYFVGSTPKGHQTTDHIIWNDVLLPKLYLLKEEINEGAARLLRLRGQARLSVWTALGYVFPDVARYTLEVSQQGELWRSDMPPSNDFEILSDEQSIEPQMDSYTVAVAIGIAVPIEEVEHDVRRYLEAGTSLYEEPIKALLSLWPNRQAGSNCFQNNGDATVFAQQAKEQIRAFVKRHGAARLLLFYAGPLSGAAFLGHNLNACCREIHLFEYQQPDYIPSFILVTE